MQCYDFLSEEEEKMYFDKIEEIKEVNKTLLEIIKKLVDKV